MQYTELKRTLRTRVQERMEYAKDISDEEVENAIDEVLVLSLIHISEPTRP